MSDNKILIKNKLASYHLKIEKEMWKKFKGSSYILGFDSVNDCLKHLIEDCVKRVQNGVK